MQAVALKGEADFGQVGRAEFIRMRGTGDLDGISVEVIRANTIMAAYENATDRPR